MAKNIIISQNYIVIDRENSEGLLVFPFSSIYLEDANSFTIRVEPRSEIFEIKFSSVGDWSTDVSGATAFTEATLRTFLQTNTGL
tara:strand:- start:1188 stop:1442 length:255 start_codon:yes stop_codon:yes gene_type:complete